MRQLHAQDEATRARVVAALAAALASNPRVAFAYLYGSFAEGRAFRDPVLRQATREAFAS